MAEEIALDDLAKALCFHPQTLCRTIFGTSSPKSKWSEPVSLISVAAALQADAQALSLFLKAQADGEDEACDRSTAAMILDCTEDTVRNRVKAGKLSCLVKSKKFMRFSREALRKIASAS